MIQCPQCDVEILAVDVDVDPRRITLRMRAQCGHELPPTIARQAWDSGMRWTIPVVDGVSLGAAERWRQVHEEGYTAAHDDRLEPNDLTWAAWCLLDAAASETPTTDAPRMWPSNAGEWKAEHTSLRRLVIALALIAAEIDRRLRETR